VVAFDGPDAPKLYATGCRVGSISVTNRPLAEISDLSAQPRYRSEAVSVEPQFLDDGSVELTFEKPIRALTPGQICGFYEGEMLVGGGVFQNIHHEK
jgi:tRNA-specific 2-thiouridylase